MARKQALVSREKRLGATNAYIGAIPDLMGSFDNNEPFRRIRTFAQTATDDIIQALRFLNKIAGAGLVIHGARGCASAELFLAPDTAWAVTNLNERDTIMGSDAILRKAILDLHGRHKPWVIFVVATPVVAINNDDIRSVALELSDELNIPVLPVPTDGFRSRIAGTGYDAAIQVLLQLVPHAGGPVDPTLINLIALNQYEGLRELTGLLEELGLTVNLLPFRAGKGEIEKAGQAALSVVIDPDVGETLAEELERVHQVPYLKLPVPVGYGTTWAWLAAIGEATSREAAAPALHEPQEKPASAFAGSLVGKRVYIALPATAAFAVASLILEAGGTLAGISVDQVDVNHIAALKALEEKQEGVTLHVAEGQPFELVNLLRRSSPDLYIGTPGCAVLGAQAGIPTLAVDWEELIGSGGTERLLKQAHRALLNPALAHSLSLAGTQRYQASWYRRSPDWHIKLEVK